jgi:hypothetical protein
MSLNNSVSIVTRLWPTGSRKWGSTPGRRNFLYCLQHPDRLWDPPSLLPNECRQLFLWGWISWHRNFTTYLLVPRLSMHGGIPPLSHVSSGHGAYLSTLPLYLFNYNYHNKMHYMWDGDRTPCILDLSCSWRWLVTFMSQYLHPPGNTLWFQFNSRLGTSKRQSGWVPLLEPNLGHSFLDGAALVAHTLIIQ